MPSKRQREQRNAARAASVEFFKKRRLESSSVHDSLQPSVDNDKPDTTDTSLTDTSDEEEVIMWQSCGTNILFMVSSILIRLACY